MLDLDKGIGMIVHRDTGEAPPLKDGYYYHPVSGRQLRYAKDQYKVVELLADDNIATCESCDYVTVRQYHRLSRLTHALRAMLQHPLCVTKSGVYHPKQNRANFRRHAQYKMIPVNKETGIAAPVDPQGGFFYDPKYAHCPDNGRLRFYNGSCYCLREDGRVYVSTSYCARNIYYKHYKPRNKQNEQLQEDDQVSELDYQEQTLPALIPIASIEIVSSQSDDCTRQHHDADLSDADLSDADHADAGHADADHADAGHSTKRMRLDNEQQIAVRQQRALNLMLTDPRSRVFPTFVNNDKKTRFKNGTTAYKIEPVHYMTGELAPIDEQGRFYDPATHEPLYFLYHGCGPLDTSYIKRYQYDNKKNQARQTERLQQKVRHQTDSQIHMHKSTNESIRPVATQQASLSTTNASACFFTTSSVVQNATTESVLPDSYPPHPPW